MARIRSKYFVQFENVKIDVDYCTRLNADSQWVNKDSKVNSIGRALMEC